MVVVISSIHIIITFALDFIKISVIVSKQRGVGLVPFLIPQFAHQLLTQISSYTPTNILPSCDKYPYQLLTQISSYACANIHI